jgi:hypothetical protein
MSSKRRQPLILAQEIAASAEPPIPFVTARRFWILVYLYLASSAISALIARFVFRPALAKILLARRGQAAHVRGLLTELVKRTGEALNISRKEGGGVVVDTTRHKLLVHNFTQTGEGPATATISTDEKPAAVTLPTGSDAALGKIKTAISSLRRNDEGEAYQDTLERTTAFTTYLDSLTQMAYQRSYAAPGASGSTDKGIQKCRAEIRSVKGSVLNARNFPSRMRQQQSATPAAVSTPPAATVPEAQPETAES